MNQHPEKQYLNIIKEIIESGEERNDRTGVGTLSTFGKTMEYNLKDEFPLFTTKKVFWKGVVEELLWFLSGSTNVKDLENRGVKIWSANVKDNPYDGTPYDSGPIYPFQWRHSGTTYRGMNHDYTNMGVDQVQEVIDSIKNNPQSRRHIICNWSPKDLKHVCLPACFKGDTLIATKNGYVPINTIRIDDVVLTHLGNFKPVTQVHITPYKNVMNQITVEYQTRKINTTPDHPFFALKSGEKTPQWVKASDLTTNHYIGFPINTKSNIPEIEIPNKYKREMFILDNLDYWFIMGYFVGDGWVDFNSKYRDYRNNSILRNKYRFYFVFNNNDMETTFKLISKYLKMYEVKTRSSGCRKFEIRSKKWWYLLKQFGHLAHNKIIPEWVHSAPIHFIKHFLKGYIAADGQKTIPNKLRITTVSPSLAFGVQRLYLKLGHIVSVRYQKRPNKCVIEGRVVNQKDTYSVEKNFKKKPVTKSFIENNYAWYKLRKNTKLQYNGKVYNLAVAHDETYCVQNLAVHNCHVMCQFYVSNDEYLSCSMYQRSADMGLGVPFNVASYSLLTYMIAQVCNLKPGKFIHFIGDTHVYKNHVEPLKQQIEREPKPFPTLKLNPEIKNIFDFKYEDFTLENYQYHPTIKMKMAV